MLRSSRRTGLGTALALLAICAVTSGPVRAQTAPAPNASTHPAMKTIGQPSAPQVVPSLIVLSAGGATLKDGKLVLSSVAPVAILFADRPARGAGHALTTHLLEEWADGSDSFAKDPPNATVSVLSKTSDDVRDAVVTLKSPKLSGTTLTFDVAVLEGSLDGADGPASVFIDDANLPAAQVSSASTARHTASKAAWYGSAAQYAPYYGYKGPIACGYPPYPPCY